MVSYKVVSPVTGDVQRTSSRGTFRSGGMAFSVKENLAPGEEAKYNKAGGTVETPQINNPEEIKPAEQEVVVKVPKEKKVVTPIKPKKTVEPKTETPEGIPSQKQKKVVEPAPEAPVEGEGSGWWW